MNCERVRELLSPHLDGVLVDPEQTDLRRHLDRCQDCREHFESLDQVVSLIRGIPPASAPGGFRDAVRSGLVPRSATKSRLLHLIPRVAAAVLLVSCGYLGAVTFLRDSGAPPVAGGLVDTAAEKMATRDSVLSADDFDDGVAQSPPVAEPPAPASPVDAPLADSSIGIGGGAGGGLEARPMGETAVVTGTRSREKAERSLEYVVSGGTPDATAGLILAELQNRRSRTTRAESRSAMYDPGAPRGHEEVYRDEEGEPARLVLYLTADEVRYILTLLARRNGAATRIDPMAEAEGKPGAEGDADDAEQPAPDSGQALGKARSGAKERSRPEEDKADKAKDLSHRFRVELRFDR